MTIGSRLEKSPGVLVILKPLGRHSNYATSSRRSYRRPNSPLTVEIATSDDESASVRHTRIGWSRYWALEPMALPSTDHIRDAMVQALADGSTLNSRNELEPRVARILGLSDVERRAESRNGTSPAQHDRFADR